MPGRTHPLWLQAYNTPFKTACHLGPTPSPAGNPVEQTHTHQTTQSQGAIRRLRSGIQSRTLFDIIGESLNESGGGAAIYNVMVKTDRETKVLSVFKAPA